MSSPAMPASASSLIRWPNSSQSARLACWATPRFALSCHMASSLASMRSRSLMLPGYALRPVTVKEKR